MLYPGKKETVELSTITYLNLSVRHAIAVCIAGVDHSLNEVVLEQSATLSVSSLVNKSIESSYKTK